MSHTPLEPEFLDTIFSALGHTKRRAMVLQLGFNPATVKKLADEYKVSLPAMHKHIRMLEEASLIQRKKVGRTNFVAINRTGILAAQNWLGMFHAHWGTNEETLENYIEHLSQDPK